MLLKSGHCPKLTHETNCMCFPLNTSMEPRTRCGSLNPSTESTPYIKLPTTVPRTPCFGSVVSESQPSWGQSSGEDVCLECWNSCQQGHSVELNQGLTPSFSSGRDWGPANTWVNTQLTGWYSWLKLVFSSLPRVRNFDGCQSPNLPNNRYTVKIISAIPAHIFGLFIFDIYFFIPSTLLLA